MGKCKLKNFSVEEVKQITSESYSMAEVIRKLGYETIQGSNYGTLYRYFNKYKIDTSHFSGQFWSKGKTKEEDQRIKSHPKWINQEDILVNPCPTTRAIVRKFLLRNNLLEYKCECCGNDGNWQEKQIALELDHIDGNEDNAELSNLRWLCPNCHAITETYCGKNIKSYKDKEYPKKTKVVRKIYKCYSCGKECTKSKSMLCKECYNKLQREERPSKECLKEEIRNNSFVKIGKNYSVTDKTISKWCLNYQLPSTRKEINSYTDEEWELI